MKKLNFSRLLVGSLLSLCLWTLEKLTIEIDILQNKIAFNEKAYTKRLKGVVEKLRKQYSDKQTDLNLERRLFNEEIKILKVLVVKLKNEKEFYIKEIKELKEILSIPRKHFKYQEGVDTFGDLVNKKNEYFKASNLSEDHSQLTYDTRSTR